MIITGINQLLPLFLLIFIGIFLGKTGLLSAQFRKELIELCFLVLFPASVVHSFDMDVLDIETLANSAKLIFVGAVWLVIPLVLSIWLTKALHMDNAAANVLIFAAVYNNFGFAGLGIVSNLYGAQGMLYANMLGVAYRVTNMPLGIWIMERGKSRQSGASFASVLKSPPVAALLIMVPLALLGIRLPQAVYDTAEMLNSCLAPLGMMVTGMSIADFSISELMRGKVCYLISAVRLIALPALMAGIMLAMHVDGIAFAAPLLIMGMPVAANCSLLAQKFGTDSKLAAQCVLVSTVLSLVTIPFLVVVANGAL